SRSTLELIRRYRLPGYVLVGAALRTEPILDHFELAVVGQNVFDFDYADDVPRPDRVTAGVPREGVLLFATLKVDF
ncbi:MAG: TonB-dependent receptor, partial [Myxococcaceae bacterium]|nr:TonB-dependent receptor [Myxococcaceae bacterium]